MIKPLLKTKPPSQSRQTQPVAFNKWTDRHVVELLELCFGIFLD